MTESLFGILPWHRALGVLPSRPTSQGTSLQAEAEDQSRHNFQALLLSLPVSMLFKQAFQNISSTRAVIAPFYSLTLLLAPAESLAQKAGSYVLLSALSINSHPLSFAFYQPEQQFTSEFTLGIVYSMGVDKCTLARIHHCSIMQSSFAAIDFPCSPSVYPSPQPLATTDLFYSH